jgi:curved DNA-binding protein CbpA
VRGRRRAYAANCIKRGIGAVDLTDSLTLFKRLGVDVPSLSAREFSLAYYRLAKRYHPDQGNDAGHDLMANINAARTTILKAYRLRN